MPRENEDDRAVPVAHAIRRENVAREHGNADAGNGRAGKAGIERRMGDLARHGGDAERDAALDHEQAGEIGDDRGLLRAENGFAISIAVEEAGEREQGGPDRRSEGDAPREEHAHSSTDRPQAVPPPER